MNHERKSWMKEGKERSKGQREKKEDEVGRVGEDRCESGGKAPDVGDGQMCEVAIA